jgi:hypothetical protein
MMTRVVELLKAPGYEAFSIIGLGLLASWEVVLFVCG